MPESDKRFDLNKLLQRLRDPVRLRVFITGLALAVGYVAIYMPFNGHIEETTRKLNHERKRNNLADEIEQLRAQVESFQARLPEETDTNEWMQYVLGAIRETPLRLASLDSDDPQRVGPYEAVVLQLELEGAFEDLDSFLYWVESNERLFRVDSARIAPPRDENGKLSMQLTLLGLKG
jgi:Tfp pilus assembly protein PilO